MTVNEWFGNDGTHLPDIPEDATPAQRFVESWMSQWEKPNVGR